MLALAAWEARHGVRYLPGAIRVGGRRSDLVRSLSGGDHLSGQLTGCEGERGLSYDWTL